MTCKRLQLFVDIFCIYDKIYLTFKEFIRTMRTSIAIYFDLENIDKKLSLKKLLEVITLYEAKTESGKLKLNHLSFE